MFLLAVNEHRHFMISFLAYRLLLTDFRFFQFTNQSGVIQFGQLVQFLHLQVLVGQHVAG